MRPNKTPTIVLLAGFGLAALGLAAPAEAALLNRAWVSGHGTDAAGCGAAGSPCRTFQYTHDNIVAYGGEIDIMEKEITPLEPVSR
jgi:hypothetical protein